MLGRGASHARVEAWLRVGAKVPGFRGFAIGRTIWLEPLRAYRKGAPREEIARRIGDAYLGAIRVYESAAAASP